MTDQLASVTAALAAHYRVERELGAGGMATVYLAHDVKHDRDVAIKVLHPELAAALGGERFLAEIKTTAKLSHPHILPLLDSGSADGNLFYVMPYVAGETLRTRLERERQLPLEDALRIAREVADALGSAHALGIIHRDIKPENILLQGGHALVADFGIALAVQSAGGARMTQTGLSLGTPQYMSPEQAMGEKSIDLRSDIYALGAVTYEMLTGEPPFAGPNVQAVVAKVLSSEPEPVTTIRKSVPEHVAAAVHTALEKLPADRQATAAEFLAALGDASTSRAHRATGSRARSGADDSRRVRTPWMVAFALAALVAAWGWLRPTSPSSGGASWGTSIVLPDSMALDPFSDNPEGMPTIALSPDGSQLAFVARRGGRAQLYLRRLSDFAVRAIEGTEGAIAPFFSPSGEEVAYFSETEVKRVTLADGRVRSFTSQLSDAFGGAWLADGRILVADHRATKLILFGPNGDSLRAFDCNMCSLPEPLPDARRAIVTGRNGLHIVDLESGKDTPLLRWEATHANDALRGTMARLDGDGHLVYVGPGGQVLAVPFDATKGLVTGAAVIVADEVRVESGRGAAQFTLARSGVIAWAHGRLAADGLLVRSDRSGRLDTIPAPVANYNAIDITPDGQRLLVRVGLPTGDMALQVIDVASGRVTPWLSASSIRGARWARDGRQVLLTRDSGTFLTDPESSAPPRALAIPMGAEEVTPMTDPASYSAWLDNSTVILHTDGRPMERVHGQIPVGGSTHDDRWFMSEEMGTTETAIIARSLDGTGRRLVIAGRSRYSMAGWAIGGNEFIVADFGEEALKRGATGRQPRSGGGRVEQGFYAVRYDASNHERPFGEPQLLFTAEVADFPGRNYAVGMGGRRFVFKQRAAAPPSREVRVLANWHERLSIGDRR